MDYDPVRPTKDAASSDPSLPTTLPTPDELIKLPANDIRILLNKRADEILKEENPNTFERYRDFCEEYEDPIYRAWYVSDKSGRNLLFRYTLNSHIATGSFGKVYRAVDASGNDVAVKVLLYEVRSDPNLLQCFRRGVRAMRILGDHKLNGMVAYKAASEIPAFVVMDWIDGLNVREAVEARQLMNWNNILSLSVQLSGIIRHAHALPQRVLHRDLRPENVMIKNVWSPDDVEVVVLDFDLSWHQGAYEKSTMYGSGTGGYWAPEQIERIGNASTKHAAVDSFGLGMLMFHIISGKDPVPNNHRHSGWSDTVKMAARKFSSRDWKSVPERYARLIIHATRDNQNERVDVTQIYNELLRLRDAWLIPHDVRDPDLVANEMAARCDAMVGYEWDDDTQSAIVENATGLRISLGGVESTQQVRMEFVQSKEAHQEYRRAGRARAPATDATVAALRGGGWALDSIEVGASGLRISARLGTDDARTNLDGVVRSVDKAVRAIRFD